jgi:hypothetical protein
MGDSGWFEVRVYRVEESANKAPSDTFTAHTLTVRPDGNLKLNGKAEATALPPVVTIALSLSASCP